MRNIEKLLAEMTVSEKIGMLAGRDVWHTVPVPRLGIPSIKVSDGPNGVRGAYRELGPPSISVPVGIALGATWNVDLVTQVGALLAEEMKLKGAHVLLAPTVNMHRTPIAGRNFECFSEDPFLTGEMASAYINGLQGDGVGACIKHFVANDQEFERTTISAEVDERTLHEIYLEPFRRAIRAAKPWSIMAAYNRINGVYASENDYLLKDILKASWAYSGAVISDWYGTYSDAVPAGGLELEMPGPARWMAAAHVQAALDSGALTSAALDDKIRRLLRLIERVGAFDQPEPQPERALDTPARRSRIRAVAQETIVLLKNESILPLDPARTPHIAVIGELAGRPNILGGGSAQLHVQYVVSPLTGIRERAGAGATVTYATGCHIHKELPGFEEGTLTTTTGAPGLELKIYDNLDWSGTPAFTKVVRQPDIGWFDASVPNVDHTRFCFRLQGVFTPDRTGVHDLGLYSIGMSRVFIDGACILENQASMSTHYEAKVALPLTAGQAYSLLVEYQWEGPTALAGAAPGPFAAARAQSDGGGGSGGGGGGRRRFGRRSYPRVGS